MMWPFDGDNPSGRIVCFAAEPGGGQVLSFFIFINGSEFGEGPVAGV